MCAINGLFSYRPTAPAVDPAEPRATHDHMAARGPDGQGAWLSLDRRARSSIGKADGHPHDHRKKQGKMSEFVGTRRNSCLFIGERVSNNTAPLAPSPGLTPAGGPARIDAGNDTAGR